MQLALPKGAWDVHHHIFDSKAFPYSAQRHLTPPSATVAQYQSFKSTLGISRSTLVHGLSYGHDCASLKSFLANLGRENTTGIAVISRSTTDAEICDLHAAGARGIRLDLYSEEAMYDLDKQIDMLHFFSSRITPWKWSLAFLQLNPSNWDPLASIIPTLPVNIVVDHHALLKAESTLRPGVDVATQPGMQAIVQLLRFGNFWIKLSAPYRCSDESPLYQDMREIVQTLVRANPRRVLWGSDWPHTPRMTVRSKGEALCETPFLSIDDAAWLASLKRWLSDEEWLLLMVENPQALFA